MVDSTQQLVRKAAQCDGLDAPTTQDEVQVGAGKTAQATLALNDDILWLRFKNVHDLGAPGAFSERLAIDHALEDAVGMSRSVHGNRR